MRDKTILLDHGGGGRASRRLVEELLLPRLRNPALERLDDHAELVAGGQRLSFSTDSYVVDPLFFPGGDIGKLAVHGTINDVSMGGARPIALSAGLILEEGLSIATLERVIDSMAEAAREAGVPIVTGDTKVVPRGSADKLFINTTGVGVIRPGVRLSGDQARAGDVVLLNGPIGGHGVAVMAERSGLKVPCRSDTAPLHELVHAMLGASQQVHCLRDPTRGGLAATLNEIAEASGVRVEVEESSIELANGVEAACELLGLDPLQLANEGALVAFVPASSAQAVLEAMRAHERGRASRVIGTVVEGSPRVVVRTAIGGKRIVAVPTGALLPRIC
jgi:hydrogenase expression/formation protein HypE